MRVVAHDKNYGDEQKIPLSMWMCLYYKQDRMYMGYK